MIDKKSTGKAASAYVTFAPHNLPAARLIDNGSRYKDRIWYLQVLDHSVRIFVRLGLAAEITSDGLCGKSVGGFSRSGV
jgi:hypothetical protein